jgi:hypothetical protein
MTNNQAFSVANNCSILYNSTQIKYKTAYKLYSNAKVQNELRLKLDEIKKVLSEKEATEESFNTEISAFLNDDFKGSFEHIEVNEIENPNYEEIKIFNQNNDSQFVRISDLLIALQELEIIK